MRTLLLAAALSLLLAAPASAGDPIMPLSQVSKGQRCTAYSVVQGTEVSSFDAEVLDVVSGDRAEDAPRILLRFSGEAIDRTGVGPGFSGSPIYCRDGAGTQRVIGAISESVGEYGGRVALATPIEAILAQPVDPPTGTAPQRLRAAPAGARPLAAPVSLGGLSRRVGRIFTRAAARAGRVVYTAPARPRAADFPPQQLRPGASMAAGLASGDVSAGSVGTVTYVDGDRVWGFGHPLEGAGRRSLFLQDAYVFTVVGNPVGVETAQTYKLAAPGHDLGIVSGDGLSAVAGRLGVLPERFPMRINATDQDTGRNRQINLQIADETSLGLPTGTSALALVGGAAVGDAAATILGASPSRQTGELCVRITLRERRKPLRFCNRYVTRGAADEEGTSLGTGTPMVTDFVEAATAVDEFNFGTPHITSVDVNVKVRRGLRQAFLLSARGPDVVRRGRTVPVRVRIQEVRGKARTRTIRVRVPRGMPSGERELTLEGRGADTSSGLEIDLTELLFGEEGEEDAEDEGAGDEAGPRTLGALARVVARLGRYDGVRASFPSPGDDELLEEAPTDGPEAVAQRKREVLRDPGLRLSGRVTVPVFVE